MAGLLCKHSIMPNKSALAHLKRIDSFDPPITIGVQLSAPIDARLSLLAELLPESSRREIVETAILALTHDPVLLAELRQRRHAATVQSASLLAGRNAGLDIVVAMQGRQDKKPGRVARNSSLLEDRNVVAADFGHDDFADVRGRPREVRRPGRGTPP